MKVRILSFLLTLCMVLSMVPVMAFAETETVTEVDSNTAFETAIGGTAPTVVLKGDVEYTDTISRKVTIDLNGFDLSGTIIANGDITIIDSALKGELLADFVVGSGSLVIKSAGKILDGAKKYVYSRSSISDDNKIEVVADEKIPYKVNNELYVRFDDAANAAASGMMKETVEVVLSTSLTSVKKSVDVTVASGAVLTLDGIVVESGQTLNIIGGNVALTATGEKHAGAIVFTEATMTEKEKVITNPTTAGGTLTILGGTYELDPSAFLPGTKMWLNKKVVDKDDKYVAYVGVTGYAADDLVKAVYEANRQNTMLILNKELVNIITIPKDYIVTIELAGNAVHTTIVNNGTLKITNVLSDTDGVADQVINYGDITLAGGHITRLENYGTSTVDGARLATLDNHNTATGSFIMKSGTVSAAIANAYTARGYFATGKGINLATSLNYYEVETAVAFIGNTGYYSTTEAIDAIEALTETATKTIVYVHKSLDNFRVNGYVEIVPQSIDGEKVELTNVTVTDNGKLVVNGFTYGPDTYAEIVTPVAYIDPDTNVEGDEVWFDSIQDAIAAVAAAQATYDDWTKVAPITVYVRPASDTDTGAILVDDQIKVVFDFGGNTYTAKALNDGAVVSITNENAEVTFKNGTLVVDAAVAANVIISNYGKVLALDSFNLFGNVDTTVAIDAYYGDVTLEGTTSIAFAEPAANTDDTTATTPAVSHVAIQATADATVDTSFVKVVVNTTGDIYGDLKIASTGTITYELNAGSYYGKLVTADGATGTYTIKGGKYYAIATYEEFYGYVPSTLATAKGEDANGKYFTTAELTDTTYKATIVSTGIKYLTVEDAIAYAKVNGVYVYLLANVDSLTISDAEGVNFNLVFDGYTVGDITMNGEERILISGGTVTGTITVNAGTIATYKYGSITVFKNTVIKENGGEFLLTSGKWYVADDSDILPYLPAEYNVILNEEPAEEGETPVTYYTVDNANAPQVALWDGEKQVVRMDLLEEAIAAVLAVDGEYYGCTIEVLKAGSYVVDLNNGETIKVLNTANATITCANEEDCLTIATPEVVEETETGYTIYTGYTAVAVVDGVYYESLDSAVKAAIVSGLEVTTLDAYAEAADKSFTVAKDQTVVINGATYGIGEYDDTTDYDAELNAIYYATVEDALTVATAVDQVVILRDVATITITLGTVDVKLVAAKGVKVGTINVTGAELAEGETYARVYLDGLNVETVNASANARVDIYASTIVTLNITAGRVDVVTLKATNVNVSNAIFVPHSATIATLTLDGTVDLEVVGPTTVTDGVVLAETFTGFAATSALLSGNFYGLTETTFAALNSIVKTGYVLNKTVDTAKEVVYYAVVNAENLVAVVDGYYFTEVADAITFANTYETVQVVTLLKDTYTSVVIPNETIFVVTPEDYAKITEVTVNGGYFLKDLTAEDATNKSIKSAKIRAIYVGVTYETIQEAVNAILADGKEAEQVITLYANDEYTIPAGKVVMFQRPSITNTFIVNGAGTYDGTQSLTNYTATYGGRDYIFSDLQTAVDYLAAKAAGDKNESEITINIDADSYPAVINGGNFALVAGDNATILDLTIKAGTVRIAYDVTSRITIADVADGAKLIVDSGRFCNNISAFGDKVEYNAVAVEKYLGEYYYYADLNAVMWDPNTGLGFTSLNVELLKPVSGLKVTVDTVITVTNPEYITLGVTSVSNGATVTLNGYVHVTAMPTKMTGKVVINDLDVRATKDIYTSNANVVSGVPGYKIDELCFAQIEGTKLYGFAPAEAGYNNKGYKTLAFAVTAAAKAKKDVVINLYADVEYTATSFAITNATYNLNGHTLTIAGADVIADTTFNNGTIAVLADSETYYILNVVDGVTLTLNDVVVNGTGIKYNEDTGERATVVLGQDSTLAGTNLTMKVLYVNGTYSVPSVLDVNGEVSIEKIFYANYSVESLNCVNHYDENGDHTCDFCNEQAVLVMVYGGAYIEELVADVVADDYNGYYIFASSPAVTLNHGPVAPGQHFQTWSTSGNISIDKATNALEVNYMPGVDPKATVAPICVDNEKVTVQITAPYFTVDGLSSAQIGNVVITPREGDKITITYTDPTDGIFGDILYWINDDGAIIEVGKNSFEYTVPSIGGTVIAICNAAVANESITVMFQNGATKVGTKVINYAKYTAADLDELFVPAAPALGIQKVSGWSLDGETMLENPAEIVAAIEAAIAAGETQIVFVPAIADPDPVEVTVVDENKNVLGTYSVNPAVFSSINAIAGAEGTYFSHWIVDGQEIYTDSLVYRFAEAMTVTAVYTTEPAAARENRVVVDGSAYVDLKKVILEGVYQIGDGYTMVDAGIVYSTTLIEEGDLEVNALGVKTKHITNLTDKENVTYTLTISFGSTVKTVYARAYFTWVDANGNTDTVYSDMIVVK